MGRKLTLEEFINRSNLKHNMKYNYSMVKEYINGSTKVEIVCQIHGSFYQQPKKHLIGDGCPLCGNLVISKKAKSNTNEFLKKSLKLHGNIYDYSETNYIDSRTKLIIICKKHGKFLQIPTDHLYGCGCPTCGNEKLSGLYSEKYFEKFPESKNISACIYLYRFWNENEEFYKIGISKNLNRKFDVDSHYFYENVGLKKLKLYDAYILEQKLIEKFSEFRYFPEYCFGGHSECFSSDIFNNLIPNR